MVLHPLVVDSYIIQAERSFHLKKKTCLFAIAIQQVPFTLGIENCQGNAGNLEGKIDTEKEPLGESTMMQDGEGNKLTMTKAPPKPKKST